MNARFWLSLFALKASLSTRQFVAPLPLHQAAFEFQHQDVEHPHVCHVVRTFSARVPTFADLCTGCPQEMLNYAQGVHRSLIPKTLEQQTLQHCSALILYEQLASFTHIRMCTILSKHRSTDRLCVNHSFCLPCMFRNSHLMVLPLPGRTDLGAFSLCQAAADWACPGHQRSHEVSCILLEV